MSKIIQLTAENVKRLTAVNIKPDAGGSLVVIGGNNGQGKSSVLDSIAMALGGKDELPELPVRKGEEKARIILEIDDLIIRRTFTATGGTALSVENKEGAKYPSPQAILDKLAAKLTFDPLSFMRLNPEGQAKELRKLVNLDLTAETAEAAKVYGERTILNREITANKVTVDAMQEFLSVPKEEVSSAELLAKIEAVNAHNAECDRIVAMVRPAHQAFDAALEREKSITDQIDGLNAQIKALEARMVPAKQACEVASNASSAAKLAAEKAKRQDATPLKNELANLENQNKLVRQNAAKKAAAAALAEKQKRSEAMTKRLDEIEKAKADKLAATKFPVEGLSFEGETLTFKGIPFSQASQAEQLRVSVGIAAAANPKLRVMLIRDGSLLDDNGVILLGKLATEFDLQVWLERVGKKDKCSVIIENGEVEAPAVPAEALL